MFADHMKASGDQISCRDPFYLSLCEWYTGYRVENAMKLYIASLLLAIGLGLVHYRPGYEQTAATTCTAWQWCEIFVDNLLTQLL